MSSFSPCRIFVVLLSTALAACSHSPAAERGRALTQQYQCGSCHTIPGVNAANGQFAVTLDAFGRRSYIAGHVPNTQENLVLWITAPDKVVPGTAMPNMGVTPDDAKAIAAYLERLR